MEIIPVIHLGLALGTYSVYSEYLQQLAFFSDLGLFSWEILGSLDLL